MYLLIHSLTSYLKGLQKITKSAAKSALHNASIGAQSIWNAVKSSASQISSIISQSSHLSDTSEENLAELSEMVATLFNNSNPQHIAMIEQLFHVLFPGIQLTYLLIYMLTHSHTGQPYSRLSDNWKQAGFQKNDPILDLKATGTLAVKCMIYFGSNKVHPQLTCLLPHLLSHSLKSKKCQEMVVANKENIKTNYPFAIVCVNLTLLLIDALSVRDSKYLSVQGMLSLTFSLTHSLIHLCLHSRILGDVRGPECILRAVLLLFSAGGCIMARS